MREQQFHAAQGVVVALEFPLGHGVRQHEGAQVTLALQVSPQRMAEFTLHLVRCGYAHAARDNRQLVAEAAARLPAPARAPFVLQQ